MAMVHASGGGEMDADPAKFKEMMRALHGPQAVDQQIRQALSTCWMLLPDDRKTAADLEREFRRIVDRALQNFKDDFQSFGA